MGDDNYNIGGSIIGGRNNTYGYLEGRCAEPKPSKKLEIDQSKQKKLFKWPRPTRSKKVEIVQSKETKQQLRGGYEHPPGAFSFAYSFIPYQYPSPPPYQYGGSPQMAGGDHGYYEGYQRQGYPGQFPPPNQGGYNYGMDQNYSGAQHMNMGPLPAHGGTAATGAPVYGHGQHDVTNKGLPASGSAAAGAAANGGHGQHDAVNKHAHHDHSHGGGLMAMGGTATAAATAVCSHSQLIHAR